MSIKPGPLATIEVQPSFIVVEKEAAQKFEATGFDEYGNEIPELAFLWKATGGDIDQSGLFTATWQGGRYEVMASASSNGGVATGSATVDIIPASFSEAPMLAALVRAGKLPPVDERLPENPLVIDVVEETGKYGGTMRRIYNGPRDHCNYSRLAREGLFRWSVDGFTLLPALAESWESTDGKTWTVKIRKEAKWSDGHPITADDFVYQYEDVALNTQLNEGTLPKWITVAGQQGTVQKVDDVTVRYSFPVPNWGWPVAASEEPCAQGTDGYVFAPAHYMKQFHKKYASGFRVAQLMLDGGFKTWFDLYQRMNSEKWNPERPTTRAWVLKNTFGSELLTAERNPYFYAVDPEGNQLPYVDRITWELVEDSDVIQVKAASGGVDFQGRGIQLNTYPVLKQNEQNFGFRVLLWRSIGVTPSSLFMNQNFDDDNPEFNEGDLLRTKEFRQALSVSINRNQIKDAIYLGVGQARQPIPPTGHPHGPGDQWVFKWTQYDPDLANQMLDKVLPDKDGDSFRLLPNGERLLLVITTQDAGVQEAELVARDWEAVGVKVMVDVVHRATVSARNSAADYHVIVWGVDTGCCLFSEPNKTLPVTSATHLPVWGTRYAQWWLTRGKEGTEPPPEIKRLQEMFLDGQTLPPDKGNEIAKEIYRVTADNVYIIGLVGLVPNPFVVNDDLRNVPEFAAQGWPLRSPSTAFPEQFFYRP